MHIDLNTRTRQPGWCHYMVATAFVGVLLLLPFARWVGAASLILTVTGLVVAVKLAKSWVKQEFRQSSLSTLLAAWVLIWLAMVISSVDSFDPEKSWITTLAFVRFPLMAVAVWYGLQHRILRHYVQWAVVLIIAWWVVDALIQFAVGYNTLGMQLSPERLNGVFGATNIKLGPVLAVVSPLLLEPLRNRLPKPQWLLCFAVVFVLIILIGTRAAWVMFSVVILGYLAIYAKREPKRWIKAMLWLSIVGVGSAAVAYQLSNDFAARVDRSMALLDGDRKSLDYALAQRLPIWGNAIDMAQDHAVNGVGVRAFRVAYPEYAEPGDPWVNTANNTGAHHAHHWLLEVLSETGVIGLVAWLGLVGLLMMHWRRLRATQRQNAFPFALGLAAMLFPINTHLAFYSTFWSLLFWWLLMGYVRWADYDKDSSGEAPSHG